MARFKGPRFLVLNLVFCLLLTVGCKSPQQAILSAAPTGVGTALLKIAVVRNSPFQQIARTAILTISAQDMITMVNSLSLTDSSVEGTITGIPAGQNRLFDVLVYDSAEKMQYRGSARGDVVADSTVHIFLTIARLTGTAVIDGSIQEAGSGTEPSVFALAIDSNTVALWNFNQMSGATILDESGYGNNGLAFGNASLITDSWGTGLSLPGGGGVKVSDVTTLRLSNFEITARVYPTSFSNYNNIVVKEPGGSASPGGYILRFDDNGYIHGYVKNWSWVSVGTKTAVTLNTWYLIRLVKTATSFTLYVNNDLIDSISTTVDPGSEIGDLGIGYDVNKVEDRDFIGYIDAIKIDKL